MSSTRRDPYWDNVRWVAITLVVVGHAIEKGRDAQTMTALYLVVYAFHMPLFAFVCGRFSSAEPVRREAAGRFVSQLFVPFVVFSLLWGALRLVVEDDARIDLASPYSIMWFLVALMVWRAALPYVAALRWPLATSLVIGVAAAYMDAVGSTFDGARVLGLLPFFVLGWVTRERGWQLPRPSVPLRVAAGGTLLAALAAAYLLAEPLADVRLRAWFQYDENYVDLGFPQWWAGGVRLLLVALAVLLGACALLLVPRRRSAITAWGAGTMYVYLLHLFPLYLVRQLTDAEQRVDSLPEWGLYIVAAVAWSALLSTRPVQRAFAPLVAPRVGWLLARPDARPPDAPVADAPVAGEPPAPRTVTLPDAEPPPAAPQQARRTIADPVAPRGR